MNSDDMAYIRGRNDASAGKERFPQSFHPNQYGAYNQGFYDWHKLQAFPDLLEALQFVLPVLRHHSTSSLAINESEIADIERIISRC